MVTPSFLKAESLLWIGMKLPKRIETLVLPNKTFLRFADVEGSSGAANSLAGNGESE